MDPVDTVNKLASGDILMVMAVIIVALSLTIIVLFRKLTESYDKRLQDMQSMYESSKKLADESNKSLAALNEAMREIRGRL